LRQNGGVTYSAAVSQLGFGSAIAREVTSAKFGELLKKLWAIAFFISHWGNGQFLLGGCEERAAAW